MAELEKVSSPQLSIDNLAKECSQAVGDKAPVSENDLKEAFIDRIALIPHLLAPKTYSRRQKWCISIVVSAAAVIDSASTDILYPALPEISKNLETPPAIANLVVALPTISSGIAPLYWSYVSESKGRRRIYLLSLLVFIIFSVLSAISPAMGMLIAMRMLTVGAGCAVTPLGAAAIQDIWDDHEKGRAMSIYYIGILIGPSLGPVIGGALTEKWGWRATQWFLTSYGAIIFLSVAFILPETNSDYFSSNRRRPVTETALQGSLRLRDVVLSVRASCYRLLQPFKILVLLRIPIVTIMVYFASITFLAGKALQISVQQSFAAPPFQFSALVIGLTFLPLALGLIVGDLFGGRWSDLVMQRKATKAGRYKEGSLIFSPDDRLRENAWLAFITFPAGLLWYGWSVKYGHHWIVPLIGEVFVGLGGGLIFSLVATILVELSPRRSASVIALNSLGRSIFATVGSAIAEPLQTSIGSGWMFTIIGIIFLLNIPLAILVRKYGRDWVTRVLSSEQSQ